MTAIPDDNDPYQISLHTGKVIDRYEIRGRLGRGGMATVYKAQSLATGRLVALKILQPREEIFIDLLGWQELCRVFLEEARIMGGIDHPYIAKVVDCGEHEGCPFIVLEYYSHSVGEVMGEGYQVESPSRALSPERTRHYLHQCLMGLQRLHDAGIIHRDIKPYNLMLTADNTVKIIDFGLSRVRGEDVLDIPGMQVGSPYYTAPELQKAAKDADGRADVFSLGVMGYRMLTGVLQYADQGQFIAPSVRIEGLSKGWDSLFKKALQTRPEKRFQSAEEMLISLEQFLVDPLPLATAQGTCLLRSREERRTLRSSSRRILFKDIANQLHLDTLMRPKGYYAHDLAAAGDYLVHDRTARLCWQRRGSGYTMNWQEASAYIDQLNGLHWQGKNTWRLPTMEELVILLDPDQRKEGCCLHQLFAPDIHWLWSADPSTKRQAWIVDFAEGYVSRLDTDGAASVLAVCTE